MKHAVVTGSTKGIGKAIALRLLQEGYYVFFNYAHDDQTAEEIKSSLGKEALSRCLFIKQPLETYTDAQCFVQQVHSIADVIDVLVLCCGATDKSAFCDISQDSWEYVMNVNLNVPLYLIQGFFDSFPNETASILLIGSNMVQFPHNRSLAYGVSKAGLHQMARELVKVFAPRHITINCLAPGFTDTPRQAGKDPEIRKNIINKTAMGRFGRPEEIANIAFAVLDNRFITGECIVIDGGYSFR